MGWFALSAFRISTQQLQIVGNGQAEQQATAAAQRAIDVTISSNAFSKDPAGVARIPVATDVDGDGDDDFTAKLEPKPKCIRVRPIKTMELDIAKAADRVCLQSSGSSGNLIVVPGARRGGRRFAVREQRMERRGCGLRSDDEHVGDRATGRRDPRRRIRREELLQVKQPEARHENASFDDCAALLATALSLAGGSDRVRAEDIDIYRTSADRERSAERADHLGQLGELEREHRRAELLFHRGRHPDDRRPEGDGARQGAGEEVRDREVRDLQRHRRAAAAHRSRSAAVQHRLDAVQRVGRGSGRVSAQAVRPAHARERGGVQEPDQEHHDQRREVEQRAVRAGAVRGVPDVRQEGAAPRHARDEVGSGRGRGAARYVGAPGSGCGTNNIIFISNGSPNENNTDALALLRERGRRHDARHLSARRR